MTACRWVASTQPRAVIGRHDEDCDDETCRGCQPCPGPHCGTCGVIHPVVGLHCPGCIGDAREDLTEIVRLTADLPDEAETRGAQSEAFDLAGPTANPEAWRQRGKYGHRYSTEERLGDNHPLWVLGTWDLAVTEHYGRGRRTTVITVESAASYLGRNLTDLAADPDFAFEDLARELRSCRGHLEAVLHDGEQAEKGAPCLKCMRPVTRTVEADGKIRHWCSRCRRSLTDNEYRLAVRQAHMAHADRLNAADMAVRIEVPESTIRRWANVLRLQREGESVVELDPLMRSCGRDSQNRKMYRVDDALKIRDGGGDRRRSGSVSKDGAA
jgi:hypothetical protein